MSNNEQPIFEDIDHAINTPLCGIQMAASILSEEKVGPLTKSQRKLVDILVKDSEKLIRNLNQLDLKKANK